MSHRARDLAPRMALELGVVVVGVLAALWVDGWAVSRTESRQEREILLQLSEDLGEHRELYAWAFESLDAKEAALGSVASGLRRPGQVADTVEFLRAVVGGANLGWAVPRADRSTFADLLGSGGMRLIHDPALRRTINRYFDLEDEAERRTEPRRSRYPEVSWALVPQAETSMRPADSIDAAAVFRALTASDLASHVVGEVNYTRFLRQRYRELDEAASELLGDIEAALGAGPGRQRPSP